MILKPFKREFVFPEVVAFISTMNKDGIRNIAPYSNLMPVLRPWDIVCVASWTKRDTLDNIRETKEFVINIPSIDFVDKIIPCAESHPPEVDEFSVAHLEEKKSRQVRAPSIEGCIAWVECSLLKEVTDKQYILIIGKVESLEIDDKYIGEDEGIDIERVKPLLMLQNNRGMKFVTVGKTVGFEPYEAMFPGGKDPFSKFY